MSLNDIELPAMVIAELYGDKLLINLSAPAPVPVTAPSTPSASTSVPTVYRSLGDNRKKITILVNVPDNSFLPDDQLGFITKMLEACKMNMGDVAIVNQASVPVGIAPLKKQLSPTIVVLFGLEPINIGLPINFPQFKIQAYDGCTFLSVPTLEQLGRPTEEGKLLKSKLWVCLRALFQI
jgi:hypothetical protein